MESVFIYTLIDPRTSELRYVGMTRNVERRHKQYKSVWKSLRNAHLRSWLLGIKNAGLSPTIEVIDETTEDDRDVIERFWIAHHRSLGFRLLNLTDGGEGGFKHSQESVDKIKAARKRWHESPDNPHTMPQAHRDAIRKALKGRRLNPHPSHFIVLNKARTGIPLTEAHKKRCGEALKGRKPSQKSVELASQRLKDRWADSATREKMIESARKAGNAPENKKRLAAIGRSFKGKKLSDEHRKAVSEGVRRAITPEYRQKMSEIKKGKLAHPMTEDMKKKISESLKRYFAARRAEGPK